MSETLSARGTDSTGTGMLHGRYVVPAALMNTALDRLRKDLAAELADMRLAAHRFEVTIARVERTYASLSDLVDQTGPVGLEPFDDAAAS